MASALAQELYRCEAMPLLRQRLWHSRGSTTSARWGRSNRVGVPSCGLISVRTREWHVRTKPRSRDMTVTHGAVCGSR